jgi:hypothetical protein
MKYLLYWLLLSFCVACQFDTNSGKGSEADSINTDSASVKGIDIGNDERKVVIAELKRWQHALTTHNKSEILSFFQFPISTNQLFIDPSEHFAADIEKNNKRISRQVFTENMERIWEYYGIEDEFTRFFEYMPLDSLQFTSVLEKEVHIKNDDCYYIYSVHIEEQKVHLRLGTNTNREVAEASEDEEVCSEYTSFWTFKIKNKQLLFEKLDGAG